METSDRAGEIPKEVREYMRNLALKSAKVQKKKYGKRGLRTLKRTAGLKAGETHKRKAFERARQRLLEVGEAFVGVVE